LPPILAATFLEVVAWIVMAFFWILAISIFISIFSDVFRRRDLSGFSKALWILLIVVLPLFGCLIYICVRPRMATYEQDMELLQKQRRMMGGSSVDDIAKASELLKQGAISQAEFDQIKSRALA
jgi:uncharacterized membrane protein (UPF0182 family)